MGASLGDAAILDSSLIANDGPKPFAFLLHHLDDVGGSRLGKFSASTATNCSTPMRKLAQTLAFASLFIGATQIAHGARNTSGQICWAIGKFDNTVYYAGIEERDDRSASFASLIEISGIETFPARCSTLPVASYHSLRALLVEEWMDAELEVIDTTFLSDLDY